MKTSELTGIVLNWAVAKCEGLALHKDGVLGGYTQDGWWASGYYADSNIWVQLIKLRYSTDWAQGGPIIEREELWIAPEIGKKGAGNAWCAVSLKGNEEFGPTPLIAAMRCYCASKLGGEVEVPEELV